MDVDEFIWRGGHAPAGPYTAQLACASEMPGYIATEHNRIRAYAGN
jgi:hypothetical protein